MSQTRVTNYFSQRKRHGVAGDRVKPGGGGGGGGGGGVSSGGRSAKLQPDGLLCASGGVHEEFVRLIDEAVGLGHESPALPSTAPRTPKRTSAGADGDLGGAAAGSATADHSTAKKRRESQASRESAAPGRGKRTTARRKLQLPPPSPQAEAPPPAPEAPPPAPVAPEVTQRGSAGPLALTSQPSPEVVGETTQRKVNKAEAPPPAPEAPPPAPVAPEVTQRGSAGPLALTSQPSPEVVSETTQRKVNKVLSKDDVAALKSRLRRIGKRAEQTARVVSTASSSSTPNHTNTPTPPPPDASAPTPPPPDASAPTPPPPDASALKTTVARAKDLAAKAQRRREEREAEGTRESAEQQHQQHQHQQHQHQQQQQQPPPAHQRYHSLAEAAPPGLCLPYPYRLLEEMFRSTDTVVAMLHNRCETATFAKVKQGVQDMMHKRFEATHVGQIKTVFPEAYVFRQERNIPTFSSSIKRSSYQLTLEPTVVCEPNEARPTLSVSRLLERRRIFHGNLVRTVKRHHKDFLSSLRPPMSVPDDKLTRWHPGFNVDTVPPIAVAPLPQPPHTDHLATAQEVLDKARALITPKMEKALVSLTVKSTESRVPETPQTSAPAPPDPAAQVPTALKGVSQSLLDRIRAKEAQKLQASMTRNSAQEERLVMMSRLGDLARILRTVFVAEKKPALIMEVACNRMTASYRSALSPGDMEKHVRLLAEVAGDWLTIHPVRKDSYLKLNKNMELSSVLDKLGRRLKEEEGL